MNEWVFDCVKFVEEYLTRIDLLPRPHLGVLGTVFEDKYGVASEEDASIDEEIKEFEIAEPEPLLAEVEEKSRFIPNRCQYQLLIDAKKPDAKAKIDVSFYYRVSHSQQGSEEHDPEPIKNFRNENITLRIPIMYPLPQKVIVTDNLRGSGEIATKIEGSNCSFVYEWSNESEPFKKVIKNKENENQEIEKIHKYKVRIFGRVLSTNNGFVLHLEVANLSEQSDAPWIVLPGRNELVPYTNYNYGFLLDFKIKNELENAIIKDIPNTRNITPFSEIGQYNFPTSKIEFRDYCFYKEKIPKLKPHAQNGKLISPTQSLASLEYPISPLIGKTIETCYHWNSLHKFQVEAISTIMKNMKVNPERITCVSARTAGGKTEAFLFPILDYCINNINEQGTKALLIYPTKALANDQANRINSFLTFLNQELIKSGKREITLGIYHGDIEYDKPPNFSILQCPYCEKRMNFTEENLAICENNECSNFLEKKERFVSKNLKLTRKRIFENPPDILITNPDILNYNIMHAPESHTILGRTKDILHCSECGQLLMTSKRRQKHSSLIPFAKEDDCHGMLEKRVLELCSPKFIVLDEIHLMYGSFGIHLSYLISRINNLIKRYNPNSQVIHIASSATIRNPETFLSKMYSVPENNIDVIPDKNKEHEYYTYEEIEGSINRFHLFTMPNAYKTSQTLSLAYLKILDYFKDQKITLPNVLTFVNTIAASIALIQACSGRILDYHDVKIDGHSTDFDKRERAEKEDKFNRGELQFLFATKTLEVGVDFDDISVVGLFGSPYSFNDYLQRIGRAGRKKSALVLTFYRSFNPVDAFYYSKCYSFLGYEKRIREEFMEDLPLDRFNAVIARKSVYSSILDYVASRDDAHEYFGVNVRPLFDKLLDQYANVHTELTEWVSNSVKPCGYDDNQLKILIQKALYEIKSDFPPYPTVNFKRQAREISKKYFLDSLRSSDPEIPIFIPSRVNPEMEKHFR